MNRFDVPSPDGTPLAVWVDGEGPPLVLVHGSIADHITLAPLVEVLRRDMTTFAMDRRGFGASGDILPYTIERDFEDVAAVVDAVAARTGGPVAVFGHSYGANCTMGGAALTRSVAQLVLYEPSLGTTYPPGALDAIEASITAGDLDAAAVAVLSLIGMSDAEIEELRANANPDWSTRIASAWTLPREARVEEGWTYRPGQFDTIEAPTLLLAGTESPPELAEATRQAAAAIPRAWIRVLDGHGHMAHKTDPILIADLIRAFASTGVLA